MNVDGSTLALMRPVGEGYIGRGCRSRNPLPVRSDLAQPAYNPATANELPPPRATPSDEDRALVRRMAAGDETALGALYDRWQALVHSVALQVTGDRDDAEEVVEEAFWQAWRQAGRYEETRGSISTWLTMIARSRALDRVRARRRAREERMDGVTEADEAAASFDGAFAGPLDSAMADEMRRLVAEAVAKLPPEQRQTVEMAYFRGMSQTEIAEATGQPLGTVKTRARLALQKLRDSLAVLREDTQPS